MITITNEGDGWIRVDGLKDIGFVRLGKGAKLELRHNHLSDEQVAQIFDLYPQKPAPVERTETITPPEVS